MGTRRTGKRLANLADGIDSRVIVYRRQCTVYRLPLVVIVLRIVHGILLGTLVVPHVHIYPVFVQQPSVDTLYD
jgi:hypothetical protein